MLEKSVLSRVKQRHFLPGTKNRRAVEIDVFISVYFKLRLKSTGSRQKKHLLLNVCAIR